ncbi:MAG: HPr-rel-A system PqqD family peptide chaperone [Noviherbaspirillum sp.]
MKWRLCRGQTLRLLSTDDESVIYNDRSGATHLISMPATRLLQRLQQAPADTATLAAFSALEWALEDDAELDHVVEALLAELDEAGLIEVCPS